MRTFYAPFANHQANAGCFVEIIAQDQHAARFYMISAYGGQWQQDQLSEQQPSGRRRLAKVFQDGKSKDLKFTTGRRGNVH